MNDLKRDNVRLLVSKCKITVVMRKNKILIFNAS